MRASIGAWSIVWFVVGAARAEGPAADLPVSGRAVAELAVFDRAMQQFMTERAIRAGALAVSKDGKLVLARGYGFADREGKRPLPAHAPFRIASIGKPITAAAVRKLIREGKLKADTPVFALLDLTAAPGQESDPRLAGVTVQHLLDHQGGWDRARAHDPMFRPLKIASALGKAGPADSHDVIRYMLGQPLQFGPGTEKCYSNFGYCLLGRVIEKVTGQTYVDHVRSALLEPIGIRGIELGRTLPRDRNPAEPVYLDPREGRNVFSPDREEWVPEPDGGFHLEAMDAHGGLIAPAPDLSRFLEAYWITGEPRQPGETGSHVFFGSLPGTFTMALQTPHGVNVAALFNQRTDPSGKDYFAIRDVLRKAAESVTTWPALE